MTWATAVWDFYPEQLSLKTGLLAPRWCTHPQMALTAEIRTDGGCVSWRPLTVAWRNCWINSGDIATVKRLAAQRARPRRKGDTGKEREQSGAGHDTLQLLAPSSPAPPLGVLQELGATSYTQLMNRKSKTVKDRSKRVTYGTEPKAVSQIPKVHSEHS